MKPILLVALAATALFAACGISDKEKAAIQQAQQAHDDSIRTAQITEVKHAELRQIGRTASFLVATFISFRHGPRNQDR